MKCPNCGFWNKAQFPKCFQCGYPLDGSAAAFGTAKPPVYEEPEDINDIPAEILRPQENYSESYTENYSESYHEGHTAAYAPVTVARPRDGEFQQGEFQREELPYPSAADFAEELVEFDEYYQPYENQNQSTAAYRPQSAMPAEPQTRSGTNRYNAGPGRATRNAGRQMPPQSNVVPFVSVSELERDFPVRPAPLPVYGQPIETLEHDNIYVKQPLPAQSAADTRHGGRGMLTRRFKDDPKTKRARPAPAPVTRKSEIKPIYAMKDTRRKRMALKAFFRIAIIIALLAAVGIGIYMIAPKIAALFQKPEPGVERQASVEADVRIEQLEKNGRTAHEIVFRSDIYESVYIQELKNTYLFTAGEARMLLYDDIVIGEAPEYENMSVNFMPVFYHPSGRQVVGSAISYELLIPPTGIELVQPATDYLSVQTSITTIKFKVPKGSKVTVSGEDVSDFADANGYVVQNIDTSQFGDIAVEISAQAMGHTRTEKTVTINRPYMDILIELASSVSGSSSSKTVELRGTTLPGATISLDTTSAGEGVVESDGSFSIKAQMTRIGLNEVIIRASMPGKEDTLYTLSIDYAPKLDEYSKQAWPINTQNYSDLIGYAANKVGKIYVGTGLVTEISDDSPAVYSVEMDGGLKTFIRMVEGKSLELNKRYKIYCDFESMQGALPLFVGRYYYDQAPTP